MIPEGLPDTKPNYIAYKKDIVYKKADTLITICAANGTEGGMEINLK